MDCFQYACPMHDTENDPCLDWLGLACKTVGCQCWLGSAFQITNNAYYQISSQLGVHALGIAPRTWSSSSSSANDDDNDKPPNEPLQEALCASLYASERTRVCLRVPKTTQIPSGHAPDPLKLKTAVYPCSLPQPII